METALDLEFVPRGAIVRTARDAATVVLPGLPADRKDDVRLLVSEIVTNSVRHGGGDVPWIRLRVAFGEGKVRVEVRNAGPDISFERSAKPGVLNESGWGMYLLENLADRWGVSSGEGDACVWFEVEQTA